MNKKFAWVTAVHYDCVMQPVYFAHGYREREAPFAEYFSNMLRRQSLVPSLDPPSETVNAAKLERHLRHTKGLVAVVAARSGEVSPHILFEISVAIRSGKPTAVFFEDTLSPDLFPTGIIKRRFSAKSFVRETREHLHAIELLETYIGRENLPKFVSESDHRTCLLLGFREAQLSYREAVISLVESRGFSIKELNSGRLKLPIDATLMSEIRSADLAIAILDDQSPKPMYYLGLLRASMVPTLLYVTIKNYPLAVGVPAEYQRIYIPNGDCKDGISQIVRDLDLYEEDFIELGRESAAQIYANELANISASVGEYSSEIRNTIIKEIRMGDTYNTKGQVGSVGPGAMASNNTFNQIWQDKAQEIDLGSLARELEQLRAAMKVESSSPEHDVALGAVASAQSAAEQNDGPAALSYLSSVGKWTLDVGTKIGAAVAVAAIKSGMDL